MNVKERFTKLHLFEKIKSFFKPPNTRISIILKNRRLTIEQCKDIQKMLKIDEDFIMTDTQTGWTYSRHSRKIYVGDPTEFKKRLTECGKKYPDIAFFADFISFKNQFSKIITSVLIAVISIVIKLILDMFW